VFVRKIRKIIAVRLSGEKRFEEYTLKCRSLRVKTNARSFGALRLHRAYVHDAHRRRAIIFARFRLVIPSLAARREETPGGSKSYYYILTLLQYYYAVNWKVDIRLSRVPSSLYRVDRRQFITILTHRTQLMSRPGARGLWGFQSIKLSPPNGGVYLTTVFVYPLYGFVKLFDNVNGSLISFAPHYARGALSLWYSRKNTRRPYRSANPRLPERVTKTGKIVSNDQTTRVRYYPSDNVPPLGGDYRTRNYANSNGFPNEDTKRELIIAIAVLSCNEYFCSHSAVNKFAMFNTFRSLFIFDAYSRFAAVLGVKVQK